MSADRATAIARPPLLPSAGGGTMWGLTAVFVLGIASLIYALVNDAIALDFASLTASFLYLLGVSQAAILFCAIMRLVGAQWSKPYYRLAEITTLAFAPFALGGFLLLYLYGRDELFYWLSPSGEEHLSPWLDIDWLLLRNLFGLLLFYGLSAYYAYTALKPDLAATATAESGAPRAIERRLRVLSPFVIVSFVICNTLLAWDFGMMLIEHWHSTVFPIYFSFGNLYAGTAALIAFPTLLGRSKASSEFGPRQIRNLGMLITGFTVLWLYFFWAQFFVVWFGNLPRETDALWRQMYGHYAPYFWTMMAACFFVPFVALIFAFVKRSLIAMCALAVSINLGIWLNKYLVVVPAFSPNDRPFDTWLDVALAAGLLAGFLAAVLALAMRLPIYSYWEIGLKPQGSSSAATSSER